MITLSSRLSIETDHGAVVAVRTDRCVYEVAIQDSTVTVIGPGMEEEYERGEDLPSRQVLLSNEALAMMAVLLWEEGD